MTTGPVALVTGATGGIGLATSRRLRALGYEVYAVGRNPVALKRLAADGMHARALDVTDEAGVRRLVAEIHHAHDRIDVLVNNAGFGLSSPIEQVALADLRHVLETNVVAMLHCSQAVLPLMRQRGSGTIVNVGSTAGRMTTPGAGGYHISKYGVAALSAAMRAEVQRFGVRVVLVEPTGVRNTGFITAAATAGVAECDTEDPYLEFKARYSELTGRLERSKLVTVDADTVARVIVRAVRAKRPRPRYVVGWSGKVSVLAHLVLSDRVWDWVLMRSLHG